MAATFSASSLNRSSSSLSFFNLSSSSKSFLNCSSFSFSSLAIICSSICRSSASLWRFSSSLTFCSSLSSFSFLIASSFSCSSRIFCASFTSSSSSTSWAVSATFSSSSFLVETGSSLAIMDSSISSIAICFPPPTAWVSNGDTCPVADRCENPGDEGADLRSVAAGSPVPFREDERPPEAKVIPELLPGTLSTWPWSTSRAAERFPADDVDG